MEISTDSILVSILAGGVYGFAHPGKEDKQALMKHGAKFGVILGIVLGTIDLYLAGFPGFSMALWGTIIVVIVLTVLFVAGTVVGDLLEEKLEKK